MHLCFGNHGSQTIQRGACNKLVAFLDAPEADHVVLEMARRPESELEVLREVEAELGQGIGVIDVKDTEVETPDRVARRIERKAGCLGRERIGLADGASCPRATIGVAARGSSPSRPSPVLPGDLDE